MSAPKSARDDVIGFVALNGYAREANACAGLCRETWRCIPAGLSAADADRVRRDHPLWQAIINLRHGKYKETRLSWAACEGKLLRVRELCDWRAGVDETDKDGITPLWVASSNGHLVVVRELLARGANIEAAKSNGVTSLFVASQNGRLDVVRELLTYGSSVNAANNIGATPLMQASWLGRVEVVRALLAAGADKRITLHNGTSAASIAGTAATATPGSRAAILALLAAAP
jgi:ankyrin repeat protein